jgi:hypothetical protein
MSSLFLNPSDILCLPRAMVHENVLEGRSCGLPAGVIAVLDKWSKAVRYMVNMNCHAVVDMRSVFTRREGMSEETFAILVKNPDLLPLVAQQILAGDEIGWAEMLSLFVFVRIWMESVPMTVMDKWAIADTMASVMQWPTVNDWVLKTANSNLGLLDMLYLEMLD